MVRIIFSDDPEILQHNRQELYAAINTLATFAKNIADAYGEHDPDNQEVWEIAVMGDGTVRLIDADNDVTVGYTDLDELVDDANASNLEFVGTVELWE